MKTIITLLLLFTSTVAFVQTKFVPSPQAVPRQPTPTLAIGSKAPDFRLPDTDGTYYSLKNFVSAKNGTAHSLILF